MSSLTEMASCSQWCSDIYAMVRISLFLKTNINWTGWSKKRSSTDCQNWWIW
jgi:hypothetical protein